MKLSTFKDVVSTAGSFDLMATLAVDRFNQHIENIVNKALERFNVSVAKDHINIKDFGAIGNGQFAYVKEWYTVGAVNYRGYADLAAVQKEYPHVESADDSIDWAACQAAVNIALKMGEKAFAPKGRYMLSRTVQFKHTGSYYRLDTGQILYGIGFGSCFTRDDPRPATYCDKNSPVEELLRVDKINSLEACFSLAGSNNLVENIRITSSPIGLYLGQDYKVTDENSGACHNTFDRILFDRCGTASVMSASQGNHYNDYRSIHFVQNQIDHHMKNGGRWQGSDNNNRNTFFKIRSARSRVGLWIESGDSNTIYTWHGEGVDPTGNQNPYPTPQGLPGGLKSCVHIIQGQLNRIFGSQMESCSTELYNDGYLSEFYGNGYHEYVYQGTQVINKRRVGKFISGNSFATLNFAVIANTNDNAFPGALPGRISTLK